MLGIFAEVIWMIQASSRKTWTVYITQIYVFRCFFAICNIFVDIYFCTVAYSYANQGTKLEKGFDVGPKVP